MDGLLGPLSLFLVDKCFVFVVLNKSVDFELKVRNPLIFFSIQFSLAESE